MTSNDFSTGTALGGGTRAAAVINGYSSSADLSASAWPGTLCAISNVSISRPGFLGQVSTFATPFASFYEVITVAGNDLQSAGTNIDFLRGLHVDGTTSTQAGISSQVGASAFA